MRCMRACRPLSERKRLGLDAFDLEFRLDEPSAAATDVKRARRSARADGKRKPAVDELERDCVVDKLLASPGESLAVDQAIIAFK